MNQPFFSVIIPTYNRKQSLKLSIQSVLSQTDADFELLIIDDGSTDASKEMIASLANKRIRYLSQPNQGPSLARNRGICEAKGEFICFLDSDDRFRNTKLEITRQYIENNPDYQIFHTEEIWYKSGQLQSQKKYHKKPHGDVFAQAVKLCCISPSAVTINRAVFSEVGTFDETMPVCEDYDLWLRVTAKYPVYLIPQALTIKQGGHSDQQSKKYPAIDKYRIYALTKILKDDTLNKELFAIALAELKNKCAIFSKGALKRGNRQGVRVNKELIVRLEEKYSKL